MNILYVAPDIPVPHTGNFIGGSTHVMKIAESLAKQGNQVYILSRRESKDQDKFEKLGGNIFTYRIYRGLLFPISGGIRSENRNVNKLWVFTEKSYFFIYRIVLVFITLYLLKKYHLNSVVDRGSSKGIGIFSGYLFGIPSVVEVIDPDYSKFSLRFAKKIFAYTKKIIPSEFHGKVEIVSAGVDNTIFKPTDGLEIRNKYHLVDKEVIVYVGSLSEWHGVRDLIDIATKLDESICFLLIGKNLDELYNLAQKKGVSPRFAFTSFVQHEDIPKYISAADIAIAPFNPKGYAMMEKHGFYFSPVKIFEYMACGIPIIASDVEIVREVISENECGLLAEPGDIESFRDCIRSLFGNKHLMQTFSKNGIKNVDKKYSWDRVAESILTELEI